MIKYSTSNTDYVTTTINTIMQSMSMLRSTAIVRQFIDQHEVEHVMANMEVFICTEKTKIGVVKAMIENSCHRRDISQSWVFIC